MDDKSINEENKFERLGRKYMGQTLRGATYSDNNGKYGKAIKWEKGSRGNGIWIECEHENGNFFVYRPVK